MSIALIITRGFGNGTLSGEIGKIITRGFDSGAIPPPSGPGLTRPIVRAISRPIVTEINANVT